MEKIKIEIVQHFVEPREFNIILSKRERSGRNGLYLNQVVFKVLADSPAGVVRTNKFKEMIKKWQ